MYEFMREAGCDIELPHPNFPVEITRRLEMGNKTMYRVECRVLSLVQYFAYYTDYAEASMDSCSL